MAVEERVPGQLDTERDLDRAFDGQRVGDADWGPDRASRILPPPEAPRIITDRARPRSDHLRTRILQLCGVVVVGFLVFEFALSGLLHAREQALLLDSFQARVEGFEALGPIPATGAPIGVLRIPRLEVEQVLIQGTNAEQLEAAPGHLRSTPLPGQPGNAVIMGRRTTFGGPFADIGNLTVGEPIYVTTLQGSFLYRASGAQFVANDQPGTAFASAGDNRLTLVTSDPEYYGGQRLIVTATLEGAPAEMLAAAPLAVDSSELGLAADLKAVPAFALSLLLLVGAFLFLPRAYREFPLRVAYVITTPIIVASLVLVFRSFDRLLPAML